MKRFKLFVVDGYIMGFTRISAEVFRRLERLRELECFGDHMPPIEEDDDVYMFIA